MNNTHTTITSRSLITTNQDFLICTAKQFTCNIALTIQPNSNTNTIEGLQTKMGLIEDNINLRFFTRKNKGKFFYIATIEENIYGGYHLHLILHVPENIKNCFMEKIKPIIGHKNHLPKSSVVIKEIDDLDGWVNYITKDMSLKDSFDNYFFSNQYNKYKKEQKDSLMKH